LHDDRLLAAPDPDDPDKVIFPGEAGFDEIDNRVIVDYWGNPIAYHRRLHPPGVLKQSYRALDPGINSFLPKLSDVICLRPYRVLPRQAADASFEDGSGDPTTSFALQSAEFALFSPGPDKMSDLQFVIDQGESRLPMRVDPNQYNRDNVVELGP